MSILSRFKGLLIIGMMMLGFWAWNRGSPAYRHIQNLPWYERTPYAETLPLEQRLDLYLEMQRKRAFGTWHKPDQDIGDAFIRQPEQSYQAIARRIRQGDDNPNYGFLLHDIEGKGGFTLCSQPDRRIVQRYIHKIESYPDHYTEQESPRYFTC